MKATGWQGGPASTTGAGYGIRVSLSDRDAYFDRKWCSVRLGIGGRETIVRISSSFWNRCSELRSKEIGAYMIANGLAPWPKGDPPQFELVPEGEAAFRLETA